MSRNNNLKKNKKLETKWSLYLKRIKYQYSNKQKKQSISYKNESNNNIIGWDGVFVNRRNSKY